MLSKFNGYILTIILPRSWLSLLDDSFHSVDLSAIIIIRWQHSFCRFVDITVYVSKSIRIMLTDNHSPHFHPASTKAIFFWVIVLCWIPLNSRECLCYIWPLYKFASPQQARILSGLPDLGSHYAGMLLSSRVILQALNSTTFQLAVSHINFLTGGESYQLSIWRETHQLSIWLWVISTLYLAVSHINFLAGGESYQLSTLRWVGYGGGDKTYRILANKLNYLKTVETFCLGEFNS